MPAGDGLSNSPMGILSQVMKVGPGSSASTCMAQEKLPRTGKNRVAASWASVVSMGGAASPCHFANADEELYANGHGEGFTVTGPRVDPRREALEAITDESAEGRPSQRAGRPARP